MINEDGVRRGSAQYGSRANSTESIARWESRSGKHWVELTETVLEEGQYKGQTFYGYKSPQAGGGLNAKTKPEAEAELQKRIDSGHFQPDAAKTPMVRKG